MDAAEQERSWSGMLAALAVALVIAGATLALRGGEVAATILGLRLTARWSYLLFWPAYVAGASATLFGPRFRRVAARAPDFGLAFAAAHLVHVALVVWLYRIAARPPGVGTLSFFGVAVFFTYLLALLSFPRPAARLSPRALHFIRTIGVEYIALAFLVDFVKEPPRFTRGYVLGYGVFLALGVLAYALRVVAVARRFPRSSLA